jgi:hypothetical protein
MGGGIGFAIVRCLPKRMVPLNLRREELSLMLCLVGPHGIFREGEIMERRRFRFCSSNSPDDPSETWASYSPH